MQLQDIVTVIPALQMSGLDLSQKITAIVRDSNKIVAGSIFVAIRGNSWDGHSVIEEALQQGASLVVAQTYSTKNERVITVENSRKVFAELCSIFEGEPSKKLFTVGITGTNGKTTTSFMVETILNHIDKPCGVIGTINHHLKQKIWPTNLTSPGAEDLQLRLKQFVEAGAKSVVMEVSSHALDQHRIDGTQFDVAIFTNLTQDHLDYHKTMQAYFEAKNRLFFDVLKHSSKTKTLAIVNADDSWANKILAPTTVSFGAEKGDVRFQVESMDFNGTKIKVKEAGKTFSAMISAVGIHNVYNALGASLTTRVLGMGLEETLHILSKAPSVSGRLEKINHTKSRHVFVDYAHTPDALERALAFLLELKKNTQKIFVVFGAGGNRDTKKRPIMGEIASRLADHVVVTSDNPRFENPHEIIKQITEGCSKARHLDTIENRRDAIHFALSKAKEEDIVLIAGKGHEDYQEVEGVKHYFSDQDCVKEFYQ